MNTPGTEQAEGIGAPVKSYRGLFPEAFADVVISSAVLHFARDDGRFNSVERLVEVLEAGGLFFCRLASSTGIEDQVKCIGGQRFMLPDGSERYLANEALLLWQVTRLGGQLLDPLKTTIVQHQRSMTTWVLQKGL